MKTMRKVTPMLAVNMPTDFKITDGTQYLASIKLDGIRMLMTDCCQSRSGRPLPSRYVQDLFKNLYGTALDGELMIYNTSTETMLPFNEIQSRVMTYSWVPEDNETVLYCVFDMVAPKLPFIVRHRNIVQVLADNPNINADIVFHDEIHCDAQLDDLKAFVRRNGLEGLVLRGLNAPYKHGRATVSEGSFLKWKHLNEDVEAVVTWYEPSQRRDGWGKFFELGALTVRLPDGTEGKVGTGFTMDERATLWGHRQLLVGKVVRMSHMVHGVKNRARSAAFKGFRDARTLSFPGDDTE